MRNPRASYARGFTLVEVIIAITLTAMVLGIATAALSAATVARSTVLAHQRSTETESRLRVLLTDMLRHAPAAESVNEPLLSIARTGDGATLSFLSTGVVEPFGTGPVWRVHVSQDARGLRLDATPITGSVTHAIEATAPSVRGFDVHVLEAARAGERARWRSDWPVANARPQTIALDFRGAGSDALRSVPLIVTLSPLESIK